MTDERCFGNGRRGNYRMLRCAEKLGFAEVQRQQGVYTVDGAACDALVPERRF